MIDLDERRPWDLAVPTPPRTAPPHAFLESPRPRILVTPGHSSQAAHRDNQLTMLRCERSRLLTHQQMMRALGNEQAAYDGSMQLIETTKKLQAEISHLRLSAEERSLQMLTKLKPSKDGAHFHAWEKTNRFTGARGNEQ